MEKKLIDFDKYAKIPLKLTKLRDNRFFGEHPNQIYEGAVKEGILHLELSNKYQCFFILDGPDRYFHTSEVKKIEEHQGYYLVTTLNSTYRVEFTMSAIPGVQEKYSLKLEDPE
jgi:hypothetical protein